MKKDWQIKTIDSCASTNTLLKEWLINGEAKPGMALVTKQQTHGRGRFDRVWIAPPGNLSFSLAVPAPDKTETTYQLNLVVALSLVKTIRDLFYLNALFKWPNDILLNNAKMAGILSEAVLAKKAVIIGIGLNLNSDPNDFPADLRPTLTTLRHETGSKIDEQTFLDSFLDHFSKDLETFRNQGLKAFTAFMYSGLAWKGQSVKIIESETNIYNAKILQLDENGFLQVVTDSGEIRNVVAGDVRLI